MQYGVERILTINERKRVKFNEVVHELKISRQINFRDVGHF